MGYDIPGVGKSDVEKCTFNDARYLGIVRLVSTTHTEQLPPAATCMGKFVTFKKTDSNTYTVTIDPYGSETIDGQTTLTMTEQYEVLRVYSDGSNWQIV